MMAENKQKTNLSLLLRKLNQLGSPVDLVLAEDEAEETKVEIAQAGSVYGSIVFELRDGRAGYVFDLDIVNRTSRPIYCLEIEFRTPWRDPNFEWLSDPQERHRNVHHYSFPGDGAPEFPRDQVLNQVLLSESAILQPRVPYQGWLLATGGLMPKHLRNGEQVEATLAIVASDRTEYSERIVLFAECCGVKRDSRKTESRVVAKTNQWSANRCHSIPVELKSPATRVV
jgi:hypothetical protein